MKLGRMRWSRRVWTAVGAVLTLLGGAVAWAVRDPWPIVAVIEPADGLLAIRGNFASDSQVFLTVSTDGVRSWDPATGRPMSGPTLPAVAPQARSPDGRHYAGIVHDGPGFRGEVVWGDVATGTIRGRFLGPPHPINPVTWADGGRTIRVLSMAGSGACEAWTWTATRAAKWSDRSSDPLMTTGRAVAWWRARPMGGSWRITT